VDRFTRGLGRKGRLKEGLRRRLLHALDRRLLTRNVTRLLAQSRTIQARLIRFGGIPSELLYPPPPRRPYRTEAYGDYVFAVSRLHPLKRLDLLLESAARMRRDSLGIKIAGSGEDAERLRERVDALGLRGRVELLGEVSEAELVEHYARCRAVFFAPWNEDYGFVTLEAFASGKAVLTAEDSGGPAELVRNGEMAATAADPGAMAVRLDELASDSALAETLGRSALQASRQHTWERAVDQLTRV
jgi:glycosyltransferase involved in cell wall biosynthesis